MKTIRPLSYNGADCIIVCFAIDDNISLENACSKWKNELKDLCPTPNIAKILCGCKIDKRNDDKNLIST